MEAVIRLAQRAGSVYMPEGQDLGGPTWKFIFDVDDVECTVEVKARLMLYGGAVHVAFKYTFCIEGEQYAWGESRDVAVTLVTILEAKVQETDRETRDQISKIARRLLGEGE